MQRPRVFCAWFVFTLLLPAAPARAQTTALFVHRATTANTTGNVTRLSDPAIDGNPHAIVIVTANWNPECEVSGTYVSPPVGVFYDGARWAIFTEDSAFNLAIGGRPLNATTTNTSANFTSDLYGYHDPYAAVFVTVNP